MTEVVKEYECERCKDTHHIEPKIKFAPTGCPDCCPHDGIEHLICSECGKEFEPPDFYNEDYDLP